MADNNAAEDRLYSSAKNTYAEIPANVVPNKNDPKLGFKLNHLHRGRCHVTPCDTCNT